VGVRNFILDIRPYSAICPAGKIIHMTSTDSLTGSERLARALLAAWNSGDIPRLQDALGHIAVTDRASLSALEQERIEIVQEAAKTIRVWLSGARRKHADLNIALALLRHLAGVGDQTV
jgi:hypothetical protein